MGVSAIVRIFRTGKRALHGLARQYAEGPRSIRVRDRIPGQQVDQVGGNHPGLALTAIWDIRQMVREDAAQPRGHDSGPWAICLSASPFSCASRTLGDLCHASLRPPRVECNMALVFDEEAIVLTDRESFETDSFIAKGDIVRRIIGDDEGHAGVVIASWDGWLWLDSRENDKPIVCRASECYVVNRACYLM